MSIWFQSHRDSHYKYGEKEDATRMGKNWDIFSISHKQNIIEILAGKIFHFYALTDFITSIEIFV